MTSATARYQAAVPWQARAMLPAMDFRPWFVNIFALTCVPLRYNRNVKLRVRTAFEHLMLPITVMFLGRWGAGLLILIPPTALQTMDVWAGAVTLNAWLVAKVPGDAVAVVDACAVASDPALRAAATAAATKAVLMNFTMPPFDIPEDPGRVAALLLSIGEDGTTAPGRYGGKRSDPPYRTFCNYQP